MDLHLHSTASDGTASPELLLQRVKEAGLSAVALTDHDTLEGVPAAQAAGEPLGIRVIGGCEFSVSAPWGEMHALGYFLPVGWEPLEDFLEARRSDRTRRGREMVIRLQALGVPLQMADVEAQAQGGAVGRPHVARALVEEGHARSVQDAFDRWLGWGKPGFVEKRLPTFAEVAALVHRAGGVMSAAHLKDRGGRNLLVQLKAQGLDAVEIRHPTHDDDTRRRLTNLARELGLLATGGSDWHGDDPGLQPGGRLGAQQVPEAWLRALDAARPALREPGTTVRT